MYANTARGLVSQDRVTEGTNTREMMAYSRWSKSRVAVALLVTGSIALFSNQMWADAVSDSILPITIHKHFLEGQGLVVTEGESDEAISTEGTISSSSHLFFEGKISAYVFDVDPGRVRIDGLPYDEYIHILKGRLILSPDNSAEVEYKTGDSLILPEGYTGYWTMPERYREFVIINTVSEP